MARWRFRVLVASNLFGDNGKCRRIRTEVLPGTLEQLGLLGRRLLRHLLHETLERRSEIPHIELLVVGHRRPPLVMRDVV